MIKGIKTKALLLVTAAIILASGSIGVAYACYLPSHAYLPPHQSINLMICDQDEGWGNGVRETWTASNMFPGEEFAFDGHFVGLYSQFCPRINNGMMAITCNYNSWKISQPDGMARYMVITRCTYEYTYYLDRWRVDCLTGTATKVSGGGSIYPMVNPDWQILDVDLDGRITFSDLKKRPLRHLPSFGNDAARFEMSVRFDEAAGNELQGDTFNLTMFYTLTAL